MTRFITGFKTTGLKVRRLAKREGFKLFPSFISPFYKSIRQQKIPSDLTVLMDKITDQQLEKIFEKKPVRIIDAQATEDSVSDFLNAMSKYENSEQLGFLVTCPTIYNCNIAYLFISALSKRIRINESCQKTMHLALHEAIVNGLIHGNLEMSSEYRQNGRDFVEYGRILAERLKNPSFAQKSIGIHAFWTEETLTIVIKDEGAGYVIRNTFQEGQNDSKSGRGIMFIAGIADSCTIDDFGRQITLTFDLNEVYQENNLVSINNTEDYQKFMPSSIGECRVLIIEDNLSNQTMIYRLLNVIGITMIECANDGEDGLRKVDIFRPDLIILDITMPKMSGYDVLLQLKKNPLSQNIPILIETASDTREARDKTFKMGATDFITKPINPLEFFSRVKVHLENRLLIQHLQKQLAQIEKDLIAAERMQRTLLPAEDQIELLSKAYHISLASVFKPSSKLGGDFWDIIPVSKEKFLVYICDFSGHGTSSAMNTFRLHALISQMDLSFLSDPAMAMTLMNAQLVSLLPRGQFATFFLMTVDLVENTLTYCASASPKPILINPHKEPLYLETSGMPLGISRNAIYENTVLPFEKGGRILLYSDALIEAIDKKGVRIGEKRFSEYFLSQKNNLSSETVMKRMMEAFFNDTTYEPEDDVTAILLKRK